MRKAGPRALRFLASFSNALAFQFAPQLDEQVLEVRIVSLSSTTGVVARVMLDRNGVNRSLLEVSASPRSERRYHSGHSVETYGNVRFGFA